MLLLGLLLFAASGAFAGLLIADNLGGGPETGVTVLGHNIGTVNTLGAFLAGIALTLMACAGIALMSAGLRWHRRRRAERVVADEHTAVDPTVDPATGSTADPTRTAQRPPSHPRHRFTH
ncbi:hypothetical protein ACFV4P_28715 [Kitasatospora sp. NPDC059795]|uniref:hypothetical protein n=1 Tax=Kitasatospora sp. NPDC059795 TaxID=3346949 RepID=UPI0036658D22